MSIPIGARITYRYHLVCPLNIRLVMTATVNNTVAIRFNKFKKVFIFQHGWMNGESWAYPVMDKFTHLDEALYFFSTRC